ncbi:MAG: hypothetical protein ACLUKQ_01375 [Peptococcaceae bacterium]
MVQSCFAGRKVDIYNINYSKSPQLIQKSKSLKEYSLFVHMVNVGISEGLAFGDAVTKAIRYCIAHDIMGEFLSKHGSEVENMLFTEWNMDEALAVTAEEARAEGERNGLEKGEKLGLEKGRKQEQIKMIQALDGVLSVEVIAEKLGLPLEYVQEILKKQ